MERLCCTIANVDELWGYGACAFLPGGENQFSGARHHHRLDAAEQLGCEYQQPEFSALRPHPCCEIRRDA